MPDWPTSNAVRKPLLIFLFDFFEKRLTWNIGFKMLFSMQTVKS